MIKKYSNKLGYFIASLVLLTAQITPFFIFSETAGATQNTNSVGYWCANYDGGVKFDDDTVLQAGINNIAPISINISIDAEQELDEVLSVTGQSVNPAKIIVNGANQDNVYDIPTDSPPYTTATGQEISHVIVCYDSNKTTVELKKILSPTTDSGVFDLYLNGDLVANRVVDNGGNGATSGQIEIPHDASFNIREKAGNSSVNLNNYSTSIECRNQNDVLIGSGTSNNSTVRSMTIPENKIEAGDRIVCKFINTKIQQEIPSLPYVRITYMCKANFDGTALAWNGTENVEVSVNNGDHLWRFGYEAINSDSGAPNSVSYSTNFLSINGNINKGDIQFKSTNTGAAGVSVSTTPGPNKYQGTASSNDTACDQKIENAKLKIKKIVINDNGGSADADDFGIKITNHSDPVFGSPVSQSGNTKVYESTSTFTPTNNNIIISEQDSQNYDEGSWSCSNGSVGTGLSVTTRLYSGDDVTCEITNNDKAPVVLVATKITCEYEHLLPNWGNGGPNITSTTAIDWVTNNSGCRLTSGWNFEYAFNNTANPGDNKQFGGSGWSVFGPTDNEGKTSVEISDVSNVNRIWVREQLVDGYLGFTYNIAGNNTNPISAELYCNKDVLNYDNYDFVDKPTNGNTYYCVGWNVQQAKIRVYKEVKNNDGGKLRAQDFRFTINGINEQNFAESGKFVEFKVNPGEYLISEVLNNSYSTTYRGCNIVAKPGETYNCYVKNDDKPGKIVVHKVVTNNNDGQKQAKDFRFKIGQYGKWQNFNSNGMNYEIVDAGYYRVYEDEHKSYKATYSKDCIGKIENGETKHCYIENNDIAPKVKVVKITEPKWSNDNFDLNISSDNVVYDTFTLDGNPHNNKTPNSYETKYDFKAGTILIQENKTEGWDNVWIKCFEETRYGLKYVGHPFKAYVGEDYICKVFNKQRGGILVTKFNDLDKDGVWDRETETALPGWDITIEGISNSCSEYESETETLMHHYGDLGRCDDSDLSDIKTTDENGEANFNNLKEGGYVISEIIKDGWEQTSIYCDHSYNKYHNFSFNSSSTLRDTDYAYNEYNVWVDPGVTQKCYIGNSERKIVVVLEPICLNNFPYLRFKIVPNFSATKALIQWFTVKGNDANTPEGTLVSSEEYQISDLDYDNKTNTYSKTILWPGANDSASNPDWPGWKLVNGVWVPDPNDLGGNLRPNSNVLVSVNPTNSQQVSYPPATPSCDPNPKNGVVLGASTTSTASEKLQNTGVSQKFAFALGLFLVVSALLVVSIRQQSETK